jgi:hypothetical protein
MRAAIPLVILAVSGVTMTAPARAQGQAPPAPQPGAAPPAGAPGAPPAGAADPAKPVPKWVSACEADMKKLCKEEMKGDVRPCLYKNLEQLQPDCGKFMKQYRVAELCGKDIERLCKAEAAAGQLGKCLKDKKDELSKECRSALVKGSREAQAQEKEEKKEEAAAKKDEAPEAAAAAPKKKAARKAKK